MRPAEKILGCCGHFTILGWAGLIYWKFAEKKIFKNLNGAVL